MFKVLQARRQQGFRTHAFPKQAPALPSGFRGRPQVTASLCRPGCTDCIEACPTGAIRRAGPQPAIDLGRCLFCTDCSDACSAGAISFSQDWRMAARTRAGLMTAQDPIALEPLENPLRRLFHRSLKLRQVSAGGCNACEADTNVLTTLTFDLGRFGIQFVASPRHADGLLVTGPVSANMKLALEKTYAAVSSPRIVIAVGACAVSGGLFADHPEARPGAADVVPVDLFIPGCPPNPWTILDGLLRLLGIKFP
jgi:Ni,Fe-hydrogenase III small subunit/formate hydrogenlyase subunit 6/NADH:ubiquinone oxidoreductase subunit I